MHRIAVTTALVVLHVPRSDAARVRSRQPAIDHRADAPRRERRIRLPRPRAGAHRRARVLGEPDRSRPPGAEPPPRPAHLLRADGRCACTIAAPAGSPRLAELWLAGVGRGDALAARRAGRGDAPRGPRRDPPRGPRRVVRELDAGPRAGLHVGGAAGRRGDGELVLELAVAGARASRRGDAVALATAAGRKLAYGKLAVADATGRALAARFDVPAPDRVRLVVDDAARRTRS